MHVPNIISDNAILGQSGMDIRLAACKNRVKMGKNGYPIMHEIKNITITPEILKLIADIDGFKGRWKAMQTLAPERLASLKRVATIESTGCSTRIEGAKLSDRQVEKPSHSPAVMNRKWRAMPMRWT
jgi:hypothetical protein